MVGVDGGHIVLSVHPLIKDHGEMPLSFSQTRHRAEKHIHDLMEEPRIVEVSRIHPVIQRQFALPVQ